MTGNYLLTTTAEREWWFVEAPEAVEKPVPPLLAIVLVVGAAQCRSLASDLVVKLENMLAGETELIGEEVLVDVLEGFQLHANPHSLPCFLCPRAREGLVGKGARAKQETNSLPASSLQGLVVTPELGVLLDDEIALSLHSHLGTEDDSGRQSKTYTCDALRSHVTVGWQSVTIFGAQSSRSAGGALVVDATRGVADAGMVGAIVAAGLLPHASLDGGGKRAAKVVGFRQQGLLGRSDALIAADIKC